MPNWKPIIGQSFDQAGFKAYCEGLTWTAWRPSFVVLHNTGVPSLAQRPAGLSKVNIDSLVSFYRDTQGWSAGPHLFVDDLQIWVFTPLTTPGVHSPSWNQISLGVEMLGDYATEEFDAGRGAAVRDNAFGAIATLSGVLGLDPATLRLHHEDPLTTHNCPGPKVAKSAVIDGVTALMSANHPGEHSLA